MFSIMICIVKIEMKTSKFCKGVHMRTQGRLGCQELIEIGQKRTAMTGNSGGSAQNRSD